MMMISDLVFGFRRRWSKRSCCSNAVSGASSICTDTVDGFSSGAGSFCSFTSTSFASGSIAADGADTPVSGVTVPAASGTSSSLRVTLYSPSSRRTPGSAAFSCCRCSVFGSSIASSSLLKIGSSFGVAFGSTGFTASCCFAFCSSNSALTRFRIWAMKYSRFRSCGVGAG